MKKSAKRHMSTAASWGLAAKQPVEIIDCLSSPTDPSTHVYQMFLENTAKWKIDAVGQTQNQWPRWHISIFLTIGRDLVEVDCFLHHMMHSCISPVNIRFIYRIRLFIATTLFDRSLSVRPPFDRLSLSLSFSPTHCNRSQSLTGLLTTAMGRFPRGERTPLCWSTDGEYQSSYPDDP